MRHFIVRSFSAILFLGASIGGAAALELTSSDFSDGDYLVNKHVFNGFGCSGENKSPALSWSGAPDGTKSFALTVYDPDAPTGSGWWHWVVVNLPADIASLPQGADEAALHGATQVKTDFGAPGYGGPCPPAGDHPHRYIFTVHALDTDKIELPEGATAALAGFNIRAHTIESDTLMGLYRR